MSAEALKAKGIEDFQLHYALQTIGRLAKQPTKSAANSVEALKKVAAK